MEELIVARIKNDFTYHRPPDCQVERMRVLERIASAARDVCKIYWNFDLSMKSQVQGLEFHLTELDKLSGEDNK